MHKNATHFLRITRLENCQTKIDLTRILKGVVCMRKVILLVSVLAVIVLGWFLYFNEGESIAFVSLYEVKKSDLSNTLEFSGEVQPAKMYSVMSETGGTIASLNVSEGSQVNKNDVLFELDAAQVKAQLKEAKLQYEALNDSAAQTVMAQGGSGVLAEEKAKLALALSQTTGYDYDSFNEAFGSETAEAVSEVSSSLAESLDDLPDISSLDSIDTSLLPLDSKIELAQLAVERLQNLVDSMTCKSRISGTVVSMNVNVGEVLSPGIPAMVIADTENTLITGYVYEKDLNGISEGMNVTISTDNGKFKGKVTRIGAAATEVGNITAFDTMTKVEITPEDKFNKMIGAVVDLKIILSHKDDVLTVPLDCLTKDNCVFVIGEKNIAEKRAIVTGFEDDTNVEVISGLNAGDLVITSPQNVEEGQHVDYDRGE
jgi:multidrug efflux pump subunit AcrA (membrane-fusion protein)